jgi:hypothetical protein
MTYTQTITNTFTSIVNTATVTPYNSFTSTSTITRTWTSSYTATATPTVTLTSAATQSFTITPTITLTATATTFPTPFLYYVSTDKESNGATVWLAWQTYDTYAEYVISYGTSLENTVWLTNDNNTTSVAGKFYYPLCCLGYDKTYQIQVTVYTKSPVSIMASNVITVNLGTEGQYDFSLNKISGTPVVQYSPGVIKVGAVPAGTPFPVNVANASGTPITIGEDGELTSISFIHAEQHHCEAYYWSISRTISTSGTAQYYGFVVPAGVTMHARIDLSSWDGVVQARIFNVPFGGAGVTFTAKNFCYNILGASTPTIKGYEYINTLTACSDANAVSPRRTAGFQSTAPGNQAAGGGNVMAVDEDWGILGAGSYCLRIWALTNNVGYDMDLYDYKHTASVE